MRDYALADLDRRFANVIRFGVIAEADYDAARVRVRFGSLKTDWLPWVTLRAGPDLSWWAPEPGEQVIILAPSGELAQAVVLPAVYSNAHSAPGNAPTVHRIEYEDGAVFEYDRAAHRWRVTIPDGTIEMSCKDASVEATNSVTVECSTATVEASQSVTVDTPTATFTGNVNVDGNVSVGGNVAADGDVRAGSVSLRNHRHMEQGDGSPTSPPIT